MATGTGKTFTAGQIIWRLWKSGDKKRVLFLADINILVDQTMVNDFKHFGDKMTKISRKQVDKAYEIYLGLYQSITGNEEEKNIYKQFSKDFFDLIIIDECHRGSARKNSNWREILEYFSSATQVGLTATSKETSDNSAGWNMAFEAVRDVLEKYQSKHINIGFSIGVSNSRGVFSRGLDEGGKQERDLSSKYRNWSQKIKNSHPHVLAILESIANDYEKDAQFWDNKVEVDKFTNN